MAFFLAGDCNSLLEKIPMQTRSVLVAMEAPPVGAQSGVDEAIRALTDLIELTSRGRSADSFADSSAEEVLVDTEVDGVRYLLVRMRRTGANRIQLSPREQEVVRMVAKGHPNKVIADVLNISSWTVCTHLRRIFAKLGVGSRAAMVAQLLEMGLLTSEHRMPLDAR
jgi:DNA-binding CsgD family transcriptional regulator